MKSYFILGLNITVLRPFGASLEHRGIEVSNEESIDRVVAETVDTLIIVVVQQRCARIFKL